MLVIVHRTTLAFNLGTVVHLIQFICDVIVGYHGKLGYYGCGFLVVVLLFV